MKLQQAFELNPSRTQILISLVCHLMAACALWILFAPGWMRAAALALVLLLALREHRQLLASGKLQLLVDSARPGVTLSSGGQTYFYAKNKVYACRWFAILKLMDKRRNTTLILNSDRLNSPRSYRRLRYALHGPETVDAD